MLLIEVGPAALIASGMLFVAAWALRNHGVQPQLGAMDGRLRAVIAWLPVVVWLGLIAATSSAWFSLANTALLIEPPLHRLLPGASPNTIFDLHVHVRWTAHFALYGLLFLLLAHGPLKGRNGTALVVTLVCAALDEGHQMLVPSRTARIGDIGLDFAGALIANAARIVVGGCKYAAQSVTTPQ